MGLIISICSIYAAKRMIKTQKDEIFDEILDYLGSPEGQVSVRNLGTIFAQGISKGIGLGGKVRGGKTFGIPNEFLYTILEKYMGKKTEGVKSEGNVESNGGKFG